jgi:putative endonuclease
MNLSEKYWSVYIIRSDDNQLYTGITTDIHRRWQEHTEGKAGARYFRGRVPRQLCLLEPYPDRSSASKREAAIKQLSRAQKDALIAGLNVEQLAQLADFHLSHVDVMSC